MNMFRLKKFLFLIGFLFLLFSCQSEIEEQNYDQQETVTSNSPIISYLQRVAMVKTVQDNIIDTSSYCTIKLPYTVVVNSTTIAINTAADYQKVVDNINAYTTDNDVVTINFPLTMVYYNHYEKWISNQDNFDELINYWNLYPDLLSKVNGLTINYPITINVYNSDKQIASSTAIANDKVFFNFVKNLTESQYISLKYPISITDYNNQTKLIKTNLEFENAIKYAIDYYPENNIRPLDFTQTITVGSWKLSYFFGDSDASANYNGYEFVFKNDNSVVATKDGLSETGQWEIKTEYNVKKFKINFSSGLLNKLNYNWQLFEFNNSKIRFRDAGDGNYTRYLHLEKK
jgi:hypothetical protein